ncbi:conserved protein, unknown function [Plasmodium ovale]|uniref:Uncharacterized protein n=2 Tax=Plasmodium ovale TaxID=36330 RepID=A0A1A8VUS2_PLAOA|nr:conserved protein, unknown function [Plasmodium ovale curtisi]SBS90570.1 conserved protein, unknown function [Plasmodium ovale curtisi]SCP04453.1 conserved protein, unknown function [Plasmodium ovale]
MNSLERKLKLLKYENYDIGKDDFFYIILKMEEEKIRLYKPKEREKINYNKEKNYVEHILKYLKKLNINTANINKTNIHNMDVRMYILNNLTTLALVDEYKDLVSYDEEDTQENIQDSANCTVDTDTQHLVNNLDYDDSSNNTKGNSQTKDDSLENFFELNYLHSLEKEEMKKQRKKLKVLIDQINEIYKQNNIPLLNCNTCDNENEICNVTSALHLIKEKLKNKEKTHNVDYETLFNFNIKVQNNELKDFVYIIRYMFNEKLRERKTHVKDILNELQILTYNPVIDIKQGKVGR